MMEGVAARLLCWQRGLTGWNEARQLVCSHTGESQERGRAGPQASAGSTSQRGGFLASEASWTINRDKLNYYRKMIETAGSLIEQMLPKSIHAVTPQGFELKVALFLVAYSLSCYNEF